MKLLTFLYFKNTLFGIGIGFSITIMLAFKVMTDPPSCTISLDKMSIFYLGVDNPITIVARGIPMDQLIVKASGITLIKGKGDQYIVRAATPGEASISVSNGDLTQTFKYRVKMIPYPFPRLNGGYKHGDMNSFKSGTELIGLLENFDFDASCKVLGYKVTHIPKDRDPVTVVNSGAKFGAPVQTLVNKAKVGDQYFFDEIKVKCPGDVAAKFIDSMSFTIK